MNLTNAALSGIILLTFAGCAATNGMKTTVNFGVDYHVDATHQKDDATFSVKVEMK
mgnify:CR=1 FL=1